MRYLDFLNIPKEGTVDLVKFMVQNTRQMGHSYGLKDDEMDVNVGDLRVASGHTDLIVGTKNYPLYQVATEGNRTGLKQLTSTVMVIVYNVKALQAVAGPLDNLESIRRLCNLIGRGLRSWMLMHEQVSCEQTLPPRLFAEYGLGGSLEAAVRWYRSWTPGKADPAMERLRTAMYFDSRFVGAYLSECLFIRWVMTGEVDPNEVQSVLFKARRNNYHQYLVKPKYIQ